MQVNKLVQLGRRKVRERTKSIIKHLFPKSTKIQGANGNYKGFHVNFLRRYDCFFGAYLINMNLQRFAHSNKFSTYASGGKRKFFNANFNSKKCKSSKIGHFALTQVFSLMKACNCSKNTTFNEAKKNILLSRDVGLNPGPTLKNFTHEQSAYSETKLLRYGLIPVEKGGQGNCFSVHVISHQLFK